MSKKILGLDLGSNSIGWALLEEHDGKPNKIINLGSRIFTKAVEEKNPTPKNVKRRNKRLARRVLERRARRKQRMLNYLVKLDLLPKELQRNTEPEIILNELGNPYQLRAKALNEPLKQFELGRVFLHLVQRRGFLSNRKTLLGDMIDDPDVQEVLAELEGSEDNSTERAKEETAFKKDISELRNKIENSGYKTLGGYLASLDHHDCKRNRSREGGHLRTDRKMYQDELDLIYEKQYLYHPVLTDDVKEQIDNIIFFQRPLKLHADRIGKCSLEKKQTRVKIARLEYQKFRYLQDINNLRYFDIYAEKDQPLNNEQRQTLINLFEAKDKITFPAIRTALGFDRRTEFNLEQGNKNLKGNITAVEIRAVLPDWDVYSYDKQLALVEDLLTIIKKSALKNRLMNHWQFSAAIASKLCLLEFEPDHGNLSLKAIKKLLPFLEKGEIYSDARVSAGYGYDAKPIKTMDRLGLPPEIPNPIVSKALHELRRLINALIAEYGKPHVIRIEMARELEMNTKRYSIHMKQQNKNTEANKEATAKYGEMATKNAHLGLSKYPNRHDQIKYRLWKDQNERCIYSGNAISLSVLFSAEIDVDHIVPYSQSLDDSYMNKVVCYAGENRYKGQRTPISAYGGNAEKWNQITQAISRWDRKLQSKKARFYMTESETQNRDFISTQLNDTRYISIVAKEYVSNLGADITVSKGITTAWLRHQWGLNELISDSAEKDRSDHRHHAIDAVVIACVDRAFYQALVNTAKDLERTSSELQMKNIHFDPPWQSLRNDLEEKLLQIIVSHSPQRKITGELHEETGAGFIEGIGNVNRKNLDGKFTQVGKIYNDELREIVQKHLDQYGGDEKKAFAEGVKVLHKDGKTPIKRVRILQSKTTLDKLEKTKFGVKDKAGKVFKWLAFGNMHHVAIIKNKESGEYSGQFVTTMEAHRRAMTGTTSAIKRKVIRESIINTDYGENYEFVMALHINDLVSIEKNNQRVFYRVQLLDSANKRVNLRLNTASTIKIDGETLPDRDSTVRALMLVGLKKHSINAIGKLIE